ncbi:MAG: PspA/IM30 family protein [Cellvibrionaceae bacterium]|nr:PspA/IM30 family protein [Cellvibrionaceae bacterium]
MSNWAKVFSLLNAHRVSYAENVEENPAFALISAELKQSLSQLSTMQQAFKALQSQQKLARAKVSQLAASIEEYEGYAASALNKQQSELALEVAAKIAEFESQRKTEQNAIQQRQGDLSLLQQSMPLCEQHHKRLKHQLDTLKAVVNVLHAQATVAVREGGEVPKHRTALDALKKIRDKNAAEQAQLQAASDLAADVDAQSLREKLKAAGIIDSGHSAETVLQRIAAQVNAASEPGN